MAVVKEGLQVTDVIIQEGVPTFESVNDGVAEPVVYMIDRSSSAVSIACTPRAASTRTSTRRACTSCRSPSSPLLAARRPTRRTSDAPPNRFYAYGVVARLALLAASLEIERAAPDVVPAP
jgi:glutamate--cysteine ligase